MNAQGQATIAIRAKSTSELVAAFDMTDEQTMTPDLVTVRGWIMDELEVRNPRVFGIWIDSNESSPKRFFS